MLELGRFRGTKITGDILDNKHEYLHAFAMVREAIAWLDRTLPLAARFPKGGVLREDRLPVPAEALAAAAQALGRVSSGGTMVQRYMVRGHGRRPPKSWKEQHPRWIKPYWKSPDIAAVIERTYKLKP